MYAKSTSQSIFKSFRNKDIYFHTFDFSTINQTGSTVKILFFLLSTENIILLKKNMIHEFLFIAIYCLSKLSLYRRKNKYILINTENSSNFGSSLRFEVNTRNDRKKRNRWWLSTSISCENWVLCRQVTEIKPVKLFQI